MTTSPPGTGAFFIEAFAQEAFNCDPLWEPVPSPPPITWTPLPPGDDLWVKIEPP